MKIFMLLAVATAVSNLNAMTIVKPKIKSKPTDTYAYAPLETTHVVVVRPHDELAETHSIPIEIEMHEIDSHAMPVPSAPSPVHATQQLYPVLPAKEQSHALSTATATQTMTVVSLAADSKREKEKIQLVVPYRLQERAVLTALIRVKISQLYPKWPQQLLSEHTLSAEAEYQRSQLSQNSEQEIVLSPMRHWLLESFCLCVPLFNSKKQLMIQLQRKNPSIEESDIDESEFKKIISDLIKLRIDALHIKMLKKPRPSDWNNNDYETIKGIYEKIKALPDPKDRLLLEEAVDIVWEEKPAPAPAVARAPEKPSKKSSCVIC